LLNTAYKRNYHQRRRNQKTSIHSEATSKNNRRQTTSDTRYHIAYTFTTKQWHC